MNPSQSCKGAISEYLENFREVSLTALKVENIDMYNKMMEEVNDALRDREDPANMDDDDAYTLSEDYVEYRKPKRKQKRKSKKKRKQKICCSKRPTNRKGCRGVKCRGRG